MYIVMFIVYSYAQVTVCTEHEQAVEDAITDLETHVQELEDREKEILEEVDSAFEDIRNCICKADFVRTATIIDHLKTGLIQIRKAKGKYVGTMQNILRGLPTRIRNKIIFEQKLEKRMAMSPAVCYYSKNYSKNTNQL